MVEYAPETGSRKFPVNSLGGFGYIGEERSGKHWEHSRMRREEAEGQTK
jgi:hypothetical protein